MIPTSSGVSIAQLFNVLVLNSFVSELRTIETVAGTKGQEADEPLGERSRKRVLALVNVVSNHGVKSKVGVKEEHKRETAIKHGARAVLHGGGANKRNKSDREHALKVPVVRAMGRVRLGHCGGVIDSALDVRWSVSPRRTAARVDDRPTKVAGLGLCNSERTRCVRLQHTSADAAHSERGKTHVSRVLEALAQTSDIEHRHGRFGLWSRAGHSALHEFQLLSCNWLDPI